jgi:hypothetical protein
MELKPLLPPWCRFLYMCMCVYLIERIPVFLDWMFRVWRCQTCIALSLSVVRSSLDSLAIPLKPGSKETTSTSVLVTWICQPWYNTTNLSIASSAQQYSHMTSRYVGHVIQELIALHLNMSREDGPCFSKLWKPIPHPLKKQWQASSGDAPWLGSHWDCVTLCFGCCLRSCLIFIISHDFFVCLFIHLYLCRNCTLPLSLIPNRAPKHSW